MTSQSDREHLRCKLIQTILDNCGGMRSDHVRAVLGEVEHIVMSAADDSSIDELRNKIEKRVPGER